MQRTIVTPPTYIAVSLDEIKDHLRVTHTDEDPYIQALLMTAQGQVESYLNRKLITQTWKAFFDDWPDGDAIVLPFGQLQSVTNVKYTDSDGDQSTFSSDDYIVDTDSEPGRVVLGYNESWPTATLYPSNPIEVQFVCGYGDPSSVPMPIKHAIKITAADLYENRETILVGTITSSLQTVKALLANYRLFT